MRQADTLLAFASGPSVALHFMHSVISLFKADMNLRFAADFIIASSPYIHENRNELTRAFLQTDRDWMFMVDNDMVFEPSDVFALLKAAEERGPGIYSAPYPMENGNFVCGPWSPDPDEIAYHPLQKVPDTVVPCGMVGAGFTLIHREVLEAVGEEPWRSVRSTFGEDVSFCWRAKEAGYTPWLVPVHPGHTKTIVFYADKKNTNLHGGEVDLVRVNPTDPMFRAAAQ